MIAWCWGAGGDWQRWCVGVVGAGRGLSWWQHHTHQFSPQVQSWSAWKVIGLVIFSQCNFAVRAPRWGEERLSPQLSSFWLLLLILSCYCLPCSSPSASSGFLFHPPAPPTPPPPLLLHHHPFCPQAFCPLLTLFCGSCLFYFALVLFLSVSLSNSPLASPSLSLSAVQCPAHEVRFDSTGVILSPGYPDNYPNLQMCSWLINVEKGYNITLHFELFQTEKEFDILEIFDGRHKSWSRASNTTCFST